MIHMIAKIPGENPELFKELKDRGEEVKMVNGYIIVVDIPDNYEITNLPADTEFLVCCFEQGGGMTNTGKATLVSNTRGEALYPDFVYTSGHLSNNKHAEFTIENGVLITSTKHGYIEMEQICVEKDESKVWLYKSIIWEGRIEQLPDYFMEYTQACKAAHDKANCYHCREPHFIQG